MYYMGKILQQFIYPFNWLLVINLLLITCVIRKQWKRLVFLSILQFLIVLIPSLPFVSQFLIHSLESDFPPKPIASYPKANAIVVLGGSCLQTIPPRIHVEEWYGSRLNTAIRLFKSGKSKKIIVCGGLPYDSQKGEFRTESTDMKEYLIEFGIPEVAIFTESESRNTDENASYCKQLFESIGDVELQDAKILLVTNSSHMPRASYIFNRYDWEVSEVSGGYLSTDRPFTFKDIIPSAGSLQDSQTALKEIVGRWSYMLIDSIRSE